MFKSLELSRMAQAMASHAARRQGVVAQNIAHADTPGYRARDIAPFSETYQTPDRRLSLRATHAAHLPGRVGAGFAASLTEVERAAPNAAINGNSVSLDTEMVQAAQTRLAHETALGVYATLRAITRAARGG